MLIMASIVTASAATSRLVINEVLQSVQLDRSIVAFYAAEAGVERALYQARNDDFDADAISLLAADLPNNSSYQLVAKDTEDALYASLAQDDSYQVDLFDASGLSALDNPIRSLRVSWTGAGSWLEIKWTAWTTGGVIDNPQSAYISQVSSPYTVQLNDSTVYLYRVRIIARNAPASNIQITAYNSLGAQVPIPGRASIKGLGKYPVGSPKASTQAILVTMPQQSPVSGLYDYVLYSEEDIKKEN